MVLCKKKLGDSIESPNSISYLFVLGMELSALSHSNAERGEPGIRLNTAVDGSGKHTRHHAMESRFLAFQIDFYVCLDVQHCF